MLRPLRSIRSKFVLVYLLLILFALQLVGAYFVRTLTISMVRSATDAAESQAQFIATLAAPEVSPSSGADNASIINSLPQLFTGVVYILNKDGVVVDTSSGAALIGQKRVDSVATQALVSQKRSVAIHTDPSTGEHVLAVAVPIFNQRSFLGVAEYVASIQKTYTTVRQITTIFYTGSVVVLLLTALIGVILSRSMTRPILDVIAQTRSMAKGDFTRRVGVRSDDEFGDLSMAVNHLADKLHAALADNLRERERLRAVITWMGDGVIALDAGLQTVFLNRAAEALLGRGAMDVVDALGIREWLQRGNSEGAFLRRLGSNVLHVHVTAIHQSGAADGYVAVFRDVTEQERLQQSRRDFVVNVSHELRTPLTSIKSYIEVLQEDAENPEIRSQFLQVIGQEADRMARLIDDLLQLSGLEQGRTAFNPAPVKVAANVEAAVQRFHIQILARNLQLSVACDEEAVVYGDVDWLDRLLDNLFSNAIKYTPDNGSVAVRVVAETEDVVLTVTDTGIGIPAEDLPHVFERFYRVDKARSRRMGGTGLGLALVREITERHGGTVNIASEPGSGTQVTVRLPRYRGAVDG
ncbi:ATP-binding protein [Alicyclobacillus contaminans]|uniref:ATP-binding protein n=1 Tax=Alicyclobacillus contaminans TaxID=392016 RepID=UPI0004251B94|nr:ATP-binding protein [Alicyclobacillus contaminans]